MSVLYKGYMSNVESSEDSFEKNIAAGNHQFTLKFYWDSSNEEQYDILYRALTDRAKADPLINDEGGIERDYEWLEWYSQLPGTSEAIEELLESGMMYPQSLKGLRGDVNVMANELLLLHQEALAIDASLKPLENQRVWSVVVTDEAGQSYSGTVVSGGWINNQGTTWSMRFMCDKPRIGKEDLALVEIQVEDKA